MDEAGHRIFKFEDHTWDGKWRMLLYKIPEEQRQLRDELRKELLWSGFGSFSASCWISPNPLEERVQTMIDKYDIREYVDFFEAVYKSEENENLVAKSWPLSEIEEKYQTFIEQYLPSYLEHRQAMQEQRLTDADCFVVRTNLVHEYRKFLFIDPGLPRELLPASWSGREAKQLFGQYYRLLAKPASRFFESIFEVDNDLTSKESSYDASSHPFIAKE